MKNTVNTADNRTKAGNGISEIIWTGKNLKEVLDFTGVSPLFSKWFHSFEEYEEYVHEHGDIFKLFRESGSHWEILPGTKLRKTATGIVVPVKGHFWFQQAQ